MAANVLCPCGSGRPYRDCHGPPLDPAPPEVAEAAIRALKTKLQQQVAWHRQFGAVPPPQSAKVGPHRIVQVGNRLHTFRGETFHEFLLAHLDERLGADWLGSEASKPARIRHPLAKWRNEVRRFLRRHTRPGKPIQSAVGEGVVPLYFAVAHDVFTLQHTSLLETRLLNRLKHRDQFQGARYELWVAAACRRAGFNVALEDEADVQRSHCEFSIQHPGTGRSFSVEAKSRHRPGVLGREGRFQRRQLRTPDVAQLVIRALQKQADHQRLVFVDVNLPDKLLGSTGEEITNVLGDTIAELERRENPVAPWPPTILIFTNQPFHFARPRETGCRTVVMGGVLNIPTTETAGDPNGEINWKAWPEILTLANSMVTHGSAPPGFGFENEGDFPA